MASACAELPAPWSADQRALLERFAPCLCFDPQDAHRATSAASMTDSPGARLLSAADAVIAAGGDLTLDGLGAYPCGLVPGEGDRVAVGSDPVATALAVQDRHPPLAYARILRCAGGRHVLQYWLWYHDNPKHLFGWGRHQGDWELVQVALDAGGAPVAVTGSQHTASETRRWRRAAGPDGRPVVFVAPFSHANYFEPRTRFYFPGADHPFGGGPRAVPAVVPFGGWVHWPGRWGADRGRRLAGLARVSPSPRGPARQRLRWEDPDAFAAGRAGAGVVRAVKSLVWLLGKASAPAKPAVAEASLDGRRLTVGWTGAARHVLITAHRPEPPFAMLRSLAVRDAGAEGRAELCLPSGNAACAVWVSTYNGLRQRSWPAGRRDAPDGGDPAPYLVRT